MVGLIDGSLSTLRADLSRSPIASHNPPIRIHRRVADPSSALRWRHGIIGGALRPNRRMLHRRGNPFGAGGLEQTGGPADVPRAGILHTLPFLIYPHSRAALYLGDRRSSASRLMVARR